MNLQDPGIGGWIFLALWIIAVLFYGIPWLFKRMPKIDTEKTLGEVADCEVTIARDAKGRWIDLAIWVPGRGGDVQLHAYLNPNEARMLAQLLRRAAG